MLQKQLVSLDLTNGLSKKEPEHLRIPAKLDVCENLVFDGESGLRPRDGVADVSISEALGSANVGVPRDLHVLRDRLLIENANGLHAVHDAGVVGAVGVDGYMNRCSATLTPVFSKPDGGSFTTHDSCELGGLTFIAFQDNANGVYLQVSDAAGNVNGLLTVSTGAQNVRVVAINATTVGVFYQHIASTEIRVRTVTTAAPTTMAAAVALYNSTDGANILSTNQFDVATDASGSTFVGYVNTGTDDCRACLFAWSSWNSTADFTAVGTYQNVTVARFATGEWLLAGGTNPNVDVWVRNSANTLTAATSTLGAEGALWGIYAAPGNVGECELWTYTTGSITRRRSVSTTATYSGYAVISYFLGPASRPVSVGSQLKSYMLMHFASQTQRTLLLVDETGRVVARVLMGAGTNGSTMRGSAVVASSDGNYHVLVQTVAQQLPTVLSGLSRLRISFSETLGQGVQFADCLYIPSAAPLLFDGAVLTEWGFHHYPDGLTPALGGAGSVANGTYSYTALYEWVDAAGRVHRSPAAIPVQITVTGGPRAVDVAIQNLRLTRKANVQVVLYRTLSNGTTYYRVASTPNNTGVYSVTITDTYADATIQSNAMIPFAGGVLESDAPRACRVMCTHQNRLFCAGGEDPYSVFYTQELSTSGQLSLGAEASEYLKLTVSPTLGAVTGLASQNDKLAVVCERGIWMFTGSGPDALGGNNGYSAPIRVVSDFGMAQSNCRSVCVTDAGMFFLSAQGPRLLDGNLNVARGRSGLPVGSELDYQFATASPALCVGAVHYPTKNQTRFYMNTGDGFGSRALVFDHTFGQWSEFIGGNTYKNMFGAVLWRGLPTYVCQVSANYKLHKESLQSYEDPSGGLITTYWRTSWLKTSAVQGFQRIWRVLCLGQLHRSPVGTFQLILEKDFVPDAAAAEYTSNQNVSNFTGGLTTVGSPVQFKYHVKNQKVQAIQVAVSSTDPAVAWSNITLEVGVKRGAVKLPGARQLT